MLPKYSKREPMNSVVGSSLLVVTWIASLLVVGLACQYLGSLHEYGGHTRAQIALAIGFCCIVATWIVAEVCHYLGPAAFSAHLNGFQVVATEEPDPVLFGAAAKTSDVEASAESNDEKKLGEDHVEVGAVEKAYSMIVRGLSSSAVQLRAGAEFIGILAFIYLCDRTPVFSKGKKVYDPLQFWACWGGICVVALFTLRKLEGTKPLQREQTDEWKGWMQLMFLMYHYFAEKEVYNAIRVYIAAYVFMTGFGNFSLYLKGKSFTVRRTLQMLFRLNFLGFFICVALNNEYMLYYICAMHTLFTIFVILPLYFMQGLNTSTKALYGKIALTFLCTLALYDGPSVVFNAIFGTLPIIRHLFAFHDPLHPEFTDEMHEWHFRSGLDRFIWIIGMAFALNVPKVTDLLEWIQAKSTPQRHAWHAGVGAVTIFIGGVWAYTFFLLDKLSYNRVHPYSSFIPIAAFLMLRNLLPAFRQRYLFLFAYLGRYTLETYILQFHVWMKTTGLNGSPKHLLVWIPDYYFLNLAVVSAVYMFLSVRICNVTIVIRDALIPEQLSSIAMSWSCVVGSSVLCFGASYIFK